MKCIVKNIRKDIEIIVRDKIGVAFAVLFVPFFVLIIFQIWNNIEYFAYSDLSGEYLYMKKVWETGNIFTSKYSNSSELLCSRPWPFFVLFYTLTRNLLVSTKLTMISSTVLYAISIDFFLRKMRFDSTERLIGLTIIFSLFADINCMIFRGFNAYSVFAIGLFYTLGIMAELLRNKKLNLAKNIVLFGFAFYFGLCGLRMILVLYLPIFILECIYAINSICRSKKIDKEGLVYSIILLALNSLGLITNFLILQPYMKFGHALKISFVSYENVWKDLSMELHYLLRSIGIYLDGQPMSSLSSITTIYSILFLIIFVWGIIIIHKQKCVPLSDMKIILYTCISLLLLGAYFVFTTYDGYPRYWFVLPAVFTLGYLWLFRFIRGKSKVLLWLLGAFILVSIGMNNQWLVLKKNTPTHLTRLTEYLIDSGYKRIFATYWNSSVIEFLSNEDITALTTPNAFSMSMYDWVTDRTSYTIDDEPIALVLTKEETDSISSLERQAYLLSLAEKSDSFENYNIYYYQHNPFGFNLLDYGYGARFNFMHLSYNENAYLNNGGITLSNEGVLYGPNGCLVEKGTYDIVIRGSNLDSISLSVECNPIEINEKHEIDVQDLIVTENTVKFSADFSEVSSYMSIVCANNSSNDATVNDITVVKKNGSLNWQ